MKEKLRDHINSLFADAPQTKRVFELREELFSNLLEKYGDLIAKGYSEDDAYRAVIAGIGDVDELIRGLGEQDVLSPLHMEQWRKRNALIVSVAVMLYILAPMVLIFFDEAWGNDLLGLSLFFLLAAVATGMLIYNNMTRPRYMKKEDTVVEEFKEWKASHGREKSIMGSISGLLWTAITAVYFLISFWTGAWYITWVIFIIGAALQNVIKLIFDMKR